MVIAYFLSYISMIYFPNMAIWESLLMFLPRIFNRRLYKDRSPITKMYAQYRHHRHFSYYARPYRLWLSPGRFGLIHTPKEFWAASSRLITFALLCGDRPSICQGPVPRLMSNSDCWLLNPDFYHNNVHVIYTSLNSHILPTCLHTINVETHLDKKYTKSHIISNRKYMIKQQMFENLYILISSSSFYFMIISALL